MATIPPTREERDANLDQLQEVFDEFVGAERTRLEDEIKFLRTVLDARGGAPDASAQNLASAGKLVQTEIDAFIVGS
jgi:hypothetical protein